MRKSLIVFGFAFAVLFVVSRAYATAATQTYKSYGEAGSTGLTRCSGTQPAPDYEGTYYDQSGMDAYLTQLAQAASTCYQNATYIVSNPTHWSASSNQWLGTIQETQDSSLHYVGFGAYCPDGGTLNTTTYPGFCIVNGLPPQSPCTDVAGISTWATVIVPAGASSIPTQGKAEHNGEECVVTNNSVEACMPSNPSSPTGDQLCIVNATYTGNDTSDPSILQNTASSSNCVSNSTSTSCVDSSQKTNCGTYNGQSMCLDTVPPGNCTFLPGGNYACTSDSTTSVPAASLPDNGSAGTPANPSGTITYTDSNGNLTTVSIYGSNIVAGSSNFGNGEGAQPATPYVPPATDTGNSDALSNISDTLNGIKSDLDQQKQDDDSASGQAGPTLDSSLAPDMSTSLSGFWASLTGGPWGTALSGISLTEGGTCSAGGSFTVWGHTYDYSELCSLLEQVSPLLSIVMYIFWSIVAIRIFFE